MLHQVGVLFDLYYDARKHKSKIQFNILLTFRGPSIVMYSCNREVGMDLSSSQHN